MTREDILLNSLGKGTLAEINEMNRYIDYLEQQLKEAQKRIEELKDDNKELSKDFTHSKYVDKYKEFEVHKTCESCVHRLEPNMQFPSFSCSLLGRHVRNDFYCADYEPKDKE